MIIVAIIIARVQYITFQGWPNVPLTLIHLTSVSVSGDTRKTRLLQSTLSGKTYKSVFRGLMIKLYQSVG